MWPNTCVSLCHQIWRSGVREEREKGTGLPEVRLPLQPDAGKAARATPMLQSYYTQSPTHWWSWLNAWPIRLAPFAPWERDKKGAYWEFPQHMLDRNGQFSNSFSSGEVSTISDSVPGSPSQLCHQWQNRVGDWEAEVWFHVPWGLATNNILVSRAMVLKMGCAHSGSAEDDSS